MSPTLAARSKRDQTQVAYIPLGADMAAEHAERMAHRNGYRPALPSEISARNNPRLPDVPIVCMGAAGFDPLNGYFILVLCWTGGRYRRKRAWIRHQDKLLARCRLAVVRRSARRSRSRR